ncbi:hypothetical protein CLOM_g884 [Closterium sp. NIES-68]|nr:hypothetical protein CLOM_g884 [Closterium sp. NIES-68]GJP65939.1 hypothetical protein CLOP_g22833 [Closterium sp. NIES-67]
MRDLKGPRNNAMGAISSIDAAETLDRASNTRVFSTSTADASSVARPSSADQRPESQGGRVSSGNMPLRRDATDALPGLASTAAGSASIAEGPSAVGIASNAGVATQAGLAVGSKAEPAPLIPGLPDDLATECLLRLPRQEHRAMRRVSRRWNELIQSPLYYKMRRHRNVQEGGCTCCRAIARTGCGGMRWTCRLPRGMTCHACPLTAARRMGWPAQPAKATFM